MTKTAINKCPECGGAIFFQDNVMTTFWLKDNGYLE